MLLDEDVPLRLRGYCPDGLVSKPSSSAADSRCLAWIGQKACTSAELRIRKRVSRSEAELANPIPIDDPRINYRNVRDGSPVFGHGRAVCVPG